MYKLFYWHPLSFDTNKSLIRIGTKRKQIMLNIATIIVRIWTTPLYTAREIETDRNALELRMITPWILHLI